MNEPSSRTVDRGVGLLSVLSHGSSPHGLWRRHTSEELKTVEPWSNNFGRVARESSTPPRIQLKQS